MVRDITIVLGHAVYWNPYHIIQFIYAPPPVQHIASCGGSTFVDGSASTRRHTMKTMKIGISVSHAHAQYSLVGLIG